MNLRLSICNEIEILTQISKEAFNSDFLIGLEPNSGPPNYDDVNWHKQMLKECHLFTYLDDDNNIVGGAILFKNNKTLYVGRIFIDPKYFKKGYGYSLMLDIEKYFKDCNLFKLDTPKNNIRTNSLYKKLGYIEIDSNNEEVFYEKRPEN